MAQAFDPFKKPEFLHETQRSKHIERLDKVFEGRQYDGMADWWTGQKTSGRTPNGKVFPVRERKPCVIYKLPKAAVQQVSRFLFGESRFPVIKFADPGLEDEDDVNLDPDTPTEAAEKPPSKEDIANAWLTDLIEQADLRSVVQEVAMRAISTKTAVVVAELDEGKFRFTLPKAHHCWAKFEDNSPRKKVTKLLWSYAFQKEIEDEEGRPKRETYYFRREYDDKNVYFYEDVKLDSNGKVEWGPPTEEPHGLSRCPVLWVRNAPDYSEELDGESLFEDLEDEFHALDLTLSKRHSGVVYLGSPQLVETGVKAGDGPQATVQRGGPSSFSDEFNVEFSASGPPARAIGPNEVMSYQGDKVKVEILETEGKAFDVATKHVDDIRSRILETIGVVLTAMSDTVKTTQSSTREMSARFLMLAHAPLIALVGEYREPWWRNIREILELMVTMIIDKDAADEFVDIANTEEVVKNLQTFKNDDGAFRMPRMHPVWGKFFEPSRDEILANVTATQGALETELISHETAVTQISHDFSMDDPLRELIQILAERVERETRNFNATIALQEAGVQIQTQGRTSDLDYGEILQGNGSKAGRTNGVSSGEKSAGKPKSAGGSPKRTPGSAEGASRGGVK